MASRLQELSGTTVAVVGPRHVEGIAQAVQQAAGALNGAFLNGKDLAVGQNPGTLLRWTSQKPLK